jgi:hypothetical protein
MSLIISKHRTTGEPRYDFAYGLQQVFDIGLARLYRGDELIHVSPNKGEFPISVAEIKFAKANRDRFMRDGLPYPPLPALKD